MKSRLFALFGLLLLSLYSKSAVSQCYTCMDSQAGQWNTYTCKTSNCQDQITVFQFNYCTGGQTAYEEFALSCCGQGVENWVPFGICGALHIRRSKTRNRLLALEKEGQFLVAECDGHYYPLREALAKVSAPTAQPTPLILNSKLGLKWRTNEASR